MSIEIEVKILEDTHALRKAHPLTDRTQPRGEPGEVYSALKRLGGNATTAELIPAVMSKLMGNEAPIVLERRARIAIERAIKTGWVLMSEDGLSVKANSAAATSLTGRF